MKKFIHAITLALCISLSGCATVTEWSKTPQGQAVMQAVIADAIQIVGQLIQAYAGNDDLEDQAIKNLAVKYPHLTYDQLHRAVDEAIMVHTRARSNASKK